MECWKDGVNEIETNSSFRLAWRWWSLARARSRRKCEEARYLEKGKKEFQKKNYAIAILHFKNAMQAQPQDAEPYYQLGLAYLASNDLNTAASYFRKATRIESQAHRGAIEAGGVDGHQPQQGDGGGGPEAYRRMY